MSIDEERRVTRIRITAEPKLPDIVKARAEGVGAGCGRNEEGLVAGSAQPDRRFGRQLRIQNFDLAIAR